MGFGRILASSYGESWRQAGDAGRWFLVAGFFYAVRILVFTVAFPLYAKERGFSSSEVGLLLAAVALSLFLFGVPITKLGSRGHSRLTLVVGPIIGAAGIAIILFSPETAFAQIAFGCLLAGMVSNVFWILGDPILAAVVPQPFQARVFALKFALFTVGMGVGGALGGWVPALLERAGRSELSALAGALVVVICLDIAQSVCYRKIPVTDSDLKRSPLVEGMPPERFSGLAMWGIFLLLLVPEMGMATAYQAIRPFLSLFFDETYGLAPGKTGSIIGVMQLIGGFSALLIPGIAIRLGNVTTMALLRFVGGLMVLLIVGLSALPIVLFCLLAHYSVVDGTEATFVTEAMRRLPHSWRTTFAGLAAMLWSLCSALVASISGYLQDQTGGFDASFALGAAALITSACWLRFAYHRIPDLMTAETRARTDAFLPAQSPVRMD